MSCNCNNNDSKIQEAVRSGVRKALRSEKTVSDDKVRSVVREAIRDIISEDGDDYQEFVQGVMETLNIDDPQDLTDEGREEFFDLVGQHYDEETDTADDIPTSKIKDTFSADHYASDSKVPDFLKQEEQVRQAVRTVLQNIS